ncbi:hypothetical protein ACMFMG_012210 [Clarireedia jacksonii]
MLADDINRAFFTLLQIPQRILRIVKPACVPHRKERWIMIDHLEVTKRCQIRRRTVGAASADKADRTWDYRRDHQFVIVDCRAPGLIGVDFYMRDLERFAIVVGAVAEFPVGFYSLAEVEVEGAVPGFALCFDGFEIWVWVALNQLFGVVSVGGHGERAGWEVVGCW